MSEPIISRKDAKAQGLKFYFTGKPCGRGHVAMRYTNNWACFECRRMEEPDPDARVAFRLKYQSDGRAGAWNKKWYQANKDATKEKRNKWSRDWNARNRERCRLNLQAWVDANKEQAIALWAKRRAREKGAEGYFTEADLGQIYRNQKGKCAYCHGRLGKSYHRDHVIPLTKGGTNWPRNIQLTCQACNNRKYNKDPIVFAQELGRLL